MLNHFMAATQVLRAHPFHGINRKVQLKPTAWRSRRSGSSPDAKRPPTSQASFAASLATSLTDEPSRWSGEESVCAEGSHAMRMSWSNSPLQTSAKSASSDAAQGEEPSSDQLEVAEVQFVLKWGGELTELGEEQATMLGARCRNLLYPNEGDGVLRLHASYRHDLKIYTSDEGRVQMTAAAFTKGFLDLEGQLTPILASLVSQNSSITRMLDETPAKGKAQMSIAKEAIHALLNSEEGKPLTAGQAAHLRRRLMSSSMSREELSSSECLPSASPLDASGAARRDGGKTDGAGGAMPDSSPLLLAIGRLEGSLPGSRLEEREALTNPRQALLTLHGNVEQLCQELHGRLQICQEKEGGPANGETPLLQYSRWAKLAREFYKPSSSTFDTTKIPD
eukprot:5107499-Prymnesium_polylepis.1